MDVVALLGIVWRHRWATLLVIVLTLGAAAAVLVERPPPWTGTSSYLLLEPPAPPTDAQIALDPSLASANSDNPYTRYGSSSVIIDVLARRVATEEVQRAVVAAGGTTDFEVLPSNRYGGTSPIIDVTATGPTKASVLASIDELDTQVTDKLGALQAEDQVDPTYTYTLRQIDDPEQLTRKVSNTLRLLIGLAALGALLLLVVLGTLEGLARRRRDALALPVPEPTPVPLVPTQAGPSTSPSAGPAADLADRETVAARTLSAVSPAPAISSQVAQGSVLAPQTGVDALTVGRPEEDDRLVDATEDDYDFGFDPAYDEIVDDRGAAFWLAHDADADTSIEDDERDNVTWIA